MNFRKAINNTTNPCARAPPLHATHRFYGFRYKVTGPAVHNVGFRAAIVAKADELNCFGWTQNVPGGAENGENAVVGEARCSKARGPLLQQWLEQGPYPEQASVGDVAIKVYEDTKIKLHFSHFKILQDERVTCFREEPHVCDEFKARGGAGEGGQAGGGGGGGEL
jgi:acylphosphatase